MTPPTRIMQQKAQRSILQFELSEQVSDIVRAWSVKTQLKRDLCLLPNRRVASIGLGPDTEHRGKSAFLPNMVRPVFRHIFSRQCQRLVIDRKSGDESK